MHAVVGIARAMGTEVTIAHMSDESTARAARSHDRVHPRFKSRVRTVRTVKVSMTSCVIRDVCVCVCASMTYTQRPTSS